MIFICISAGTITTSNYNFYLHFCWNHYNQSLQFPFAFLLEPLQPVITVSICISAGTITTSNYDFQKFAFLLGQLQQEIMIYKKIHFCWDHYNQKLYQFTFLLGPLQPVIMIKSAFLLGPFQPITMISICISAGTITTSNCDFHLHFCWDHYSQYL